MGCASSLCLHSDLKPENILIKSYSRCVCFIPQQLTTGLSLRCALDILHPRINIEASTTTTTTIVRCLQSCTDSQCA